MVLGLENVQGLPVRGANGGGRPRDRGGGCGRGLTCFYRVAPTASDVVGRCATDRTFKAHDKVVIDCQWHPHETSKVVTASWDGTIKYWD